MIVICKKATKRLVKGFRYEVGNLYNDGTNRYREGYVEIIGIGLFNVVNFTDTNDNPLPKINIIKPVVPLNNLCFEDIKVGDVLICETDNYKTLGKGCMYQVEEVKSTQMQRKRYYGNPYTYTEKTIKFVGMPRKLKFSAWKFRKISQSEVREMSLNSILSGKDPNIVKSKDIRKINMVANKDRELMLMLSKSIVDKSRHHLSIVDWACQKSGANLGITPADYEEILNMPLKDILNSIDK